MEYLPVVESARQFAPEHTYGPPQSEYALPQPEYGPPPTQQYGPPASPQKLITKNVYIHVPPPETEEYIRTQILEPQIPKKHYKIIFIKAPTAPTPTVPVIPKTIPDEHKTLVYVLVKKPEPQPQIEIPKVRPTEPSKPEVSRTNIRRKRMQLIITIYNLHCHLGFLHQIQRRSKGTANIWTTAALAQLYYKKGFVYFSIYHNSICDFMPLLYFL